MSNYAIKPTPEQALRTNRTQSPARLIAALACMHTIKHSLASRVLWAVVPGAGACLFFIYWLHSNVAHWALVAVGLALAAVSAFLSPPVLLGSAAPPQLSKLSIGPPALRVGLAAASLFFIVAGILVRFAG